MPCPNNNLYTVQGYLPRISITSSYAITRHSIHIKAWEPRYKASLSCIGIPFLFISKNRNLFYITFQFPFRHLADRDHLTKLPSQQIHAINNYIKQYHLVKGVVPLPV